MKIDRTTLYALLLAPALFAYSFLLVSSYINGDQIAYRGLYEALGEASISEALKLSSAYISGNEPIPAWILWIGASQDFDKDIYISFFNLSLTLSLFYFLRNNKASWIATSLVLTNFYLLVLMTGAERLKFAYIFILLATLTKGRMRALFFIVAPLAHFQSLILLAGIGAGYLSESFRRFFKSRTIKKSDLYYGATGTSLLIAFFVLFGQKLIIKAEAYAALTQGIPELSQILILFLFSLFVFKDRLRISLTLLPIAVAAFLFGADRINMIAFSAVFYFLVIERRISTALPLTLLTYFSYKSIGFIQNIFAYGNGFYASN